MAAVATFFLIVPFAAPDENNFGFVSFVSKLPVISIGVIILYVEFSLWQQRAPQRENTNHFASERPSERGA
jgi:hypothetical protein